MCPGGRRNAGATARPIPEIARDGRGEDMSISLDEIDRRIIALLQENGRISSLEISRRIGGLSDRAVRYRVERLLASKVIFIGAVVNAEAIGLPIMGDVLIDVVPWKLRDVVARLAALERVSYVAACLETGSLSIQVNTSSEWELRQFVTDTVRTIDGVLECRTMAMPRLVKDVTDWRVPSDAHSPHAGRRRVVGSATDSPTTPPRPSAGGGA